MSKALRQKSPARAGATILIVVIVGLQLWAIVAYRDDWPFASNSMFTFRREPSDHVYDLAVEVRGESGWRRLDPEADLGLPPESFRRLLFARWYGSTSGNFPQRSFSADDGVQFRRRLTELCHEVGDELRDRGRPADALRLRLAELERGSEGWVVLRNDLVGSCNPITGVFLGGATV